MTAQREEWRRLADEASDAPWTVERGSIAWMIRERGHGPQIGNVIVEEDAAFIAAAREAVPSLLDYADASDRAHESNQAVFRWEATAALARENALLAQLDEAEVREGELRAALEAVNPGLIADRVLLLIKEATEARDAALAKGKP